MAILETIGLFERLALDHLRSFMRKETSKRPSGQYDLHMTAKAFGRKIFHLHLTRIMEVALEIQAENC